MRSPPTDAVSRHLLGLAVLAEKVALEMAGAIGEIADDIIDTFERGGKLMFCGNGGSAADAQHLATEYVVRFRRNRSPLAAIALTTDTSLLTAAANDLGFEQVFARQISALGAPGDLLFLHSTSGVSANLLAAARAARERSVTSIALLARGGGPLAAEVDRALVLPTDEGAHAQELQIAIGHILCDLVETRLSDTAAEPA
jgi:D-sedoheptulose 7-phosphate isomerase